MNNQYIKSAVENLTEISTALSLSSKTNSRCDNVIVVQVYFSQNQNIEELQEFLLLADSAGAAVLEIITVGRRAPHAKYFVGEGKAQEIAAAVKTHNVNAVLVNHLLTPAQTRNLESLYDCRVVDRTGVILDIFAQRARSHEGKLQVELAQLNHLAARLVRRKTGLDQQKGAVGLRGPGETQLETDRRLIKVRIAQLQNRLAKVEKQRRQIAKPDKKRRFPPFLWSVIPMRANPLCLMPSHKPMFTLLINCSPRLIRPCAVYQFKMSAQRLLRIPWALYVNCRTL